MCLKSKNKNPTLNNISTSSSICTEKAIFYCEYNILGGGGGEDMRKTLPAICSKPWETNHFRMPLIKRGMKSLQWTCLCIRREFLHTVQAGLLQNDALQLVISSGSYQRYSQMSLCQCGLVHNNNSCCSYTPCSFVRTRFFYQWRTIDLAKVVSNVVKGTQSPFEQLYLVQYVYDSNLKNSSFNLVICYWPIPH